jgi:O-acetyl-ADP-ribose deacetylase (regulator of RNase III)
VIIYKEMDATGINQGVIAHGVNCQHKMASGIAKTIREKFPSAYEGYMRMPRGKQMLGIAHIINQGDDLYVANCYTQEYYGRDGGRYADPEAIETAIRSVVVHSVAMGGLPVFLPRIGCGLGGLDWDQDVLPGIQRVADDFPSIDIIVCDLPTEEEPDDTEFYAY